LCLSCDNSIPNFPSLVKTGEVLSDGQRPWVEKKLKVDKLSTVYRQKLGKPAKALRLENCGTLLTYNECDCGTKSLTKANFCKERLCPMCAWRRSLKVFGQLKQVVCEIRKQEPASRFLLLTLTAKNCPAKELSNSLDGFFAGFKRLFERKEVKQHMLGYFRALEVTYSVKRGDYHPHFHVLLCMKSTYFAKGYLSQAKWRALWQDVMRLDYLPQVDVRAVNMANDGAIAEVGKYAVKGDFWEYEVADMAPIIQTYDDALKGRRLMAYGGLMRQVHKQLNLADVETDADLVHTDDEQPTGCTCPACGSPMWEHVYEWVRKLGLYVG